MSLDLLLLLGIPALEDKTIEVTYLLMADCLCSLLMLMETLSIVHEQCWHIH